MNINNIKSIKLVLLGESGVGKSSIVLRFVTNNFRPYSESTIGASFMTKIIIIDDLPIKFHIWDTAGQEKYHSLAPMYYRGSSVAIIVYDITNKESFKTVKKWINELKQYGPKEILISIVGNKSDLDKKRKISFNIAKAYADEINAIYLETSAKDNTNIDELFIKLGKEMSKLISNEQNIQILPEIIPIKSNKNLCC